MDRSAHRNSVMTEPTSLTGDNAGSVVYTLSLVISNLHCFISYLSTLVRTFYPRKREQSLIDTATHE